MGAIPSQTRSEAFGEAAAAPFSPAVRKELVGYLISHAQAFGAAHYFQAAELLTKMAIVLHEGTESLVAGAWADGPCQLQRDLDLV